MIVKSCKAILIRKIWEYKRIVYRRMSFHAGIDYLMNSHLARMIFVKF